MEPLSVKPRFEDDGEARVALISFISFLGVSGIGDKKSQSGRHARKLP